MPPYQPERVGIAHVTCGQGDPSSWLTAAEEIERAHDCCLSRGWVTTGHPPSRDRLGQGWGACFMRVILAE